MSSQQYISSFDTNFLAGLGYFSKDKSDIESVVAYAQSLQYPINRITPVSADIGKELYGTQQFLDSFVNPYLLLIYDYDFEIDSRSDRLLLWVARQRLQLKRPTFVHSISETQVDLSAAWQSFKLLETKFL